MWSLLFILLSAESFRLNGAEMPITGFATPAGNYWLVCRDPGKVAKLWHVQDKTARAVTLPRAALYAAPQPKGEGLYLVFPHELVLYDWANQQLQRRTQQCQFTTPLQKKHPWYWLTWTQAASGPLLVIFDHRKGYACPEDGRSLISFSLPDEITTGLDMTRNTVVFAENTELYWSQQGIAYKNKSQLELSSAPPLANMELATVPAMLAGQPAWFIYGGKRGELASFGWRLLGRTNQPPLIGTGIVTRFGRDMHSSTPRMFIFTVPNKVGKQLWRLITGNSEFTCTVPAWRQDRWQVMAQMRLKITKPDRLNAAFGMNWNCDLNQDGQADLLVADDKRGLRFFGSGKDGSLVQNPIRLGNNPSSLVVLATQILEGQPIHNGWRITVRKEP